MGADHSPAQPVIKIWIELLEKAKPEKRREACKNGMKRTKEEFFD